MASKSGIAVKVRKKDIIYQKSATEDEEEDEHKDCYADAIPE